MFVCNYNDTGKKDCFSYVYCYTAIDFANGLNSSKNFKVEIKLNEKNDNGNANNSDNDINVLHCQMIMKTPGNKQNKTRNQYYYLYTCHKPLANSF